MEIKLDLPICIPITWRFTFYACNLFLAAFFLPLAHFLDLDPDPHSDCGFETLARCNVGLTVRLTNHCLMFANIFISTRNRSKKTGESCNKCQ
jgi:hypothetical protein